MNHHLLQPCLTYLSVKKPRHPPKASSSAQVALQQEDRIKALQNVIDTEVCVPF
jgi:hypothetical protein